MSTKIYQDKLEIPENIQLELENNIIKVKGKKGEIQKKIVLLGITLKKENNFVTFTSKRFSKRAKRMINTYKAHIKNMFEGVTSGFVYKLKVCSGHFPITVELKDNHLFLNNFFGEKIPRKARLMENVKVTINGDELTVEGLDKELTGQTAANIEKAAKIRRRDLRVFQDGVWITEKAGKPIK